MRKLHVATSPDQKRIYAGHVKKNSSTWAENRQDVTGEAVLAVAGFLVARGGSTLVSVNGSQPKYRMVLETLPEPGATPETPPDTEKNNENPA